MVLIIIFIIIICLIVFYTLRRKKKKREMIFVEEMENNNTQINNFIHHIQNYISHEFNSENNYPVLQGSMTARGGTPLCPTSGNINS